MGRAGSRVTGDPSKVDAQFYQRAWNMWLPRAEGMR